MSTKTQAQEAKEASYKLAGLNGEIRSSALITIAHYILKRKNEIIAANNSDLNSLDTSVSSALRDRLALNPKRIEEMAKGAEEIAELPDPLNEITKEWSRPDGLKIRKVRVPIGVIGIIYEARPNVTIDSTALCLKSGNAVMLRGSKMAFNTNKALVTVIKEALVSTTIPVTSVQFVTDTGHESIAELVKLRGLVDLIIARGSEEMVNKVSETATVPVLGHGKGVCHVYVDAKADVKMAENIAYNAKVQRPGVCNAAETLLVHSAIADKFLPGMAEKYRGAGVEIRGDGRVCRMLPGTKPAIASDWGAEYLDLIISVKIVDSLDEAIRHINTYSSGHTDTIVTEDKDNARKFLLETDSSCVMHNASTRLHDGGQFGLGAEIGISTFKLHARGTMGLTELTTTKYVVIGQGHIRE